MGLDKDRETIKELQQSVKDLQDIVLQLANTLHALSEQVRQSVSHEAIVGIPSAE